MNCIHILKYLNIFLTTFFTFLLAVFAFFQWRAVEKQNQQNLFKFRLEHYTQLGATLIEIMAYLDGVGKINSAINTNNCRIEVEKILFKLAKLNPESEYLFNEEISKEEITLFSTIQDIISETNNFNDIYSIILDSKKIEASFQRLDILVEKYLKLPK